MWEYTGYSDAEKEREIKREKEWENMKGRTIVIIATYISFPSFLNKDIGEA